MRGSSGVCWLKVVRGQGWKNSTGSLVATGDPRCVIASIPGKMYIEKCESPQR